MQISTNSGLSWRLTDAPASVDGTFIACSADATRILVAVDSSSGWFLGGLFTSTDSGMTWISNNLASTYWSCVASSSDGCKLVAGVNGGGIYTSQTTPHPVLNVTLAGGNLVLSWIIPSQPFVVQENSDLATTNWIDMASSPVLDLTNLRNQVTLPIPTGNRFYRLKASIN